MLELASAGVALGAVGALAWSTRRHRTPTPAAPSLAQLGRQLAALDPADRLEAVAGLEQHAADSPPARQVVIDLLCEHLRTVPGPPAAPDVSHRAAQRVLRMRLNTDYRDCWAPLHLDLSGAHLHDLDLSGCIVGELVCQGTQFHGTTRVTEAVINRAVCLDDAVFYGDADFTDTYFGGPVRLTGVQWHGRAEFDRDVVTGGSTGS